MIKNYYTFVNENYSDYKSDLYSFFLRNKSDIESNGLNFDDIKLELDKVLSELSDQDINEFINSLNSLDGVSEEEFKINFQDILVNLSTKVVANINENLFHNIVSFFKKIKNYLMDKIYLIYGTSMVGVGSYLTLIDRSILNIEDPEISQWISGTVLLLGLIGLAYHAQNKKSEKNIVEE